MHFMREIKTEVKSLTNIILFYGLFNRLHKDAIFLEIGKKINLTVSLSNTFTGIWSQSEQQNFKLYSIVYIRNNY